MENYSIPKQAFQPLEKFGDRIQQAIMPIIALADNRIIPLGTGFVVGSGGIMMTAKHVVEEYLTGKIQDRQTSDLHKAEGLYALYISDEKHENDQEKNVGGLWPIDFIWFTPELDIAYCWLRAMLRDGKPFNPPVALRLSPGLPSAGDPILGFGYHNSIGGMIKTDSNGQKNVSYEQKTAFSSGTIRTIYRTKRDTTMLKFPSFETTARFEPGLSGGPVFNGKSGGVCGVITSSYSGLIDNGYISYASMIWPALGIILEMVPEGGTVLKPYLAYELCKMGTIGCDESIDQVEVITNSDGSRKVAIKQPPGWSETIYKKDVS